MLPKNYRILNCETVNNREYMLVMNKVDNYYVDNSNMIQFLIIKKYDGLEFTLKIKEFKCNFLTNKVIRSKKQLMRKEFYNYINGLKELKGEI